MFDSDSEEEATEFKINQNYAKKYDEWRNKEELQKLKDRYGDVALNSDEEDESSTDESEDEDAKEWNDTMEKSFLATLSLIKSRNEKIYNKDEVIFKQPEEEESNKESKTKEKPVYLKDLEREMILDKMNKDKSDDDEDVENDDNNYKEVNKNTQSKSYFEEQSEIKESFKKLNTQLDEGDDDLLKVKKKTKEEKEKEQEDYLKWLKGQEVSLKDKKLETDIKYLRDYWNDPSLTESDRFLRDFILNKRYLDKEDDEANEELDEKAGTSILVSASKSNLKAEDVNELIEDEKALETQEEFERKYNFRFEEPDPEFIKSYPRTLNDSLRRKDTKRKEKREEYKERKEAEKLKKKEEIKRLKNLKKKEIIDKIDKIKQITGNDDLVLNVDDFEKDFDPKEYDRKMEEMFNSNYYAEQIDEEKPVFSDDDLSDIEIYDDDDWIDQIEADEEHPEPKKNKKKKKKKAEENEFVEAEDPDFDMDCEAQEQKKDKTTKKSSKFKNALAQSKPEFDPNEKSFEEYFEEYYKLDCEDVIGGDLPCRFKYREVVANDFGLEVDEILNAKDTELNTWASLKKAVAYRPIKDELSDVRAYKDRSKNIEKKKKILSTVYNPEPESDENDDEEITKESNDDQEKNNPKENSDKEKIKTQVEVVTIRDTNKKNNKKKQKDTLDDSEDVQEPIIKKQKPNGEKKTEYSDKVQKQTKNKKKKNLIETINDDRLKAFGINPKKFHKKLKYSGNQNKK